ncbi:uncharacterized protein LAESUDRAFT_816144 [Laetiporus sulphureus 93-53]|uniref:Tail specific protease domain-containing protein n=1 Tax=Laetiporus sulphureus 93-53 TaxID=1314785 RepID=A0A165BHG1_9APHY|nr:uncharacterized protein LAESUDRAFT_816144 [Laetiporus sulphureus 93-53]KZT01062.1 hypothetical protein LAESUDRAFT_816144 [Laetiporus sulphureus 93-53]
MIGWKPGKMARDALAVLLGGLIAAIWATPIVHRDPCSAIANQTWVSPQNVRACFTSFSVETDIKENIIEVVNKTLAFHTSVNYQRLAPPPFSNDVHEDILADLARISSQKHASDFDFHLDLSRAFKRLNDGHCVYINLCYDYKHVHIAPEAFEVASAEFGEEIEWWQEALPGELKGQLSSLSGAKVLLIDGVDPFVAVNANALITGGYQGYGTRQNSFFSSYNRAETGWVYVMGNFAQQSLPLIDSVILTIQRLGSDKNDTIVLPYRSRISPSASPWRDAASLRVDNCIATNSTNGVDLYAEADVTSDSERRQQPLRIPTIIEVRRRKHHMNALVNAEPQQSGELPPRLTPPSALNGSSGVAQFHMLNDSRTGVLALGSFSASSFKNLQRSLLDGLQGLKEQGADRLIVDVTNNGGGYICIAHWLHRLIAGPKNTTIPQAGLQTQTRAGPLAQFIVQEIASGADPENQLLYNPLNWEFANNTPFPASLDWLYPPVEKIVNRREDAFSQRLGDECQPFETDPPTEALFDPKKVTIVSNGRCESSCSLFSIAMSKEEGTKTVVVGGKADVPQQYCGIVGGQSTRFADIDTEIKTAGLKNHSLAPPDFKTNSIQGITWRLGFGIDDPSRPEEWQDHPADVNLPLTADIVNKPIAIWETVARNVL